jgi:hypothetical protein
MGSGTPILEPPTASWQARAIDLLSNVLDALEAYAPVVSEDARLRIEVHRLDWADEPRTTKPQDLVELGFGLVEDFHASDVMQDLQPQAAGALRDAVESLSQITSSSGEAVSPAQVRVIVAAGDPMDPLIKLGLARLMLADAQSLYAGTNEGWCYELPPPPAPCRLVTAAGITWRVCDHNPSHRKVYP